LKQFDICRNKGHARAATPYFVIVQSNRFAGLATRLVVPLIVQRAASPALKRTVEIEGVALAFNPVLMFAIACDKLGPVIGPLDEASKFAIVAAIDLAIESGYR